MHTAPPPPAASKLFQLFIEVDYFLLISFRRHLLKKNLSVCLGGFKAPFYAWGLFEIFLDAKILGTFWKLWMILCFLASAPEEMCHILSANKFLTQRQNILAIWYIYIYWQNKLTLSHTQCYIGNVTFGKTYQLSLSSHTRLYFSGPLGNSWCTKYHHLDWERCQKVS